MSRRPQCCLLVLVGIPLICSSVATSLYGQALSRQAPPAHDAGSGAASWSEVRTHRLLKSSNGIDDYTLTEIVRHLPNDTDQTVVLAENMLGERFLLTHEKSVRRGTEVYELRQGAGDDFIRVTLSELPPNARAATTTDGALNQTPAKDRFWFEYTTAGNGRASGYPSQWHDRELQRSWRTRLRSILAPQFLEQLEILQVSGFVLAIGPGFASVLVENIMYRARCAPPVLRTVSLPGDCRFDQRFGLGCSDEQQRHAAQASAAGVAAPY
jgi:hypothetical protein